jgi:signal transduction histidine kinase
VSELAFEAVQGARWRASRYVVSIALVAAAYYGSARLGYELSFSGPVAAIVWLPAGVGIAALSVGGLGLWPGILVGDLLANDYSTLPLGAAFAQTAGNVLEVVIAAALVRRLSRRGPPLDTVGGVASIVGAIAAGTAVSATIGVSANLAWNVVSIDEVPLVWRTWWLGDASGALIVVPLALAWATRPFLPAWSKAKTVEAAAVVVAIVTLSELALHAETALMYIVFPALGWAALRFGQRGATAAVPIAVGIAVWHTVHFGGPFHYASISHSVLSVQLYAAVLGVTTLCLAALVAEREASALGLNRSRARLVEAADDERRRLERNLHDGAQHRLTALAYFLRTAAERVDAEPRAAASMFERAESEVELAIDELRELAHGIHPTVLTDLGLAHALKSVAARSRLRVELAELPTRRTDVTAEATAYYVVSEAVTNAERHAQATTIRIRATTARKMLYVVVEDDGRGGADPGAGSGLQGLADRVEAVGGRFFLGSTRGRGTRLEAFIPAP